MHRGGFTRGNKPVIINPFSTPSSPLHIQRGQSRPGMEQYTDRGGENFRIVFREIVQEAASPSPPPHPRFDGLKKRKKKKRKKKVVGSAGLGQSPLRVYRRARPRRDLDISIEPSFLPRFENCWRRADRFLPRHGHRLKVFSAMVARPAFIVKKISLQRGALPSR